MKQQSGFSLVELMVVVALIAVLAAVVVPSFFREAAKARGDAEVSPILAELASRVEGSKLSMGVYQNTLDADWFPDALHPTGAPIGTLPAAWQALNMAISPQKEVRCQYLAVSGAGGDDANVEEVGDLFGFVAPPINWYYVAAKCDIDNDPAVLSYAFQSSVDSTLRWENRGR